MSENNNIYKKNVLTLTLPKRVSITFFASLYALIILSYIRIAIYFCQQKSVKIHQTDAINEF